MCKEARHRPRLKRSHPSLMNYLVLSDDRFREKDVTVVSRVSTMTAQGYMDSLNPTVTHMAPVNLTAHNSQCLPKCQRKTWIRPSKIPAQGEVLLQAPFLLQSRWWRAAAGERRTIIFCMLSPRVDFPCSSACPFPIWTHMWTALIALSGLSLRRMRGSVQRDGERGRREAMGR